MIDFQRDASNYNVKLIISEIDTSTQVSVSARLSQIIEVQDNFGLNMIEKMLSVGLNEFKIIELKKMGKDYDNNLIY